MNWKLLNGIYLISVKKAEAYLKQVDIIHANV